MLNGTHALSPQLALKLLKLLPVGVVLVDPDGRVAWVNDEICAQMRVSEQALLGRPYREVPAKSVLTLMTSADVYHVAGTAEQPERWLDCRSKVVTTGEGAGLEVRCMADITPYEQARKRRSLSLALSDPSRLDAETGLLTEKAIMSELVAEVSRSRRYGNPLTLMMVSVPYRNPAAGAEADGETQQAVGQVAKVLKERLRWVDFAGRWGQQHVLVVLPETQRDSAVKLAASLNESMPDSGRPPPDAATVPVAVEVGVTDWRKGDDALSMINRVSDLLRAGDGQHSPKVAVG
ncbi:MAG: sensor domain-containing diguanylate cyclase [Gammaproteobacteria bacterium]